MLAPYRYLKLFLLSAPSSYNLYHHDPLNCINCSMKFCIPFGTFVSLENDMDHAHVFYISLTMVLLLEKNVLLMLPCTAQKLDICSCGVLLSCMWYTKQLLICPYFFSGLAGMLSSSNPPSTLRWLDSSSGIGFHPFPGLPIEPLPVSETSVVVVDISSVVILN